eukprot:6214774-Pleurochrysis_carterae.AAC.3
MCAWAKRWDRTRNATIMCRASSRGKQTTYYYYLLLQIYNLLLADELLTLMDYDRRLFRIQKLRFSAAVRSGWEMPASVSVFRGWLSGLCVVAQYKRSDFA